MPNIIPISPIERKRLIQAFHDLPESELKIARVMSGHLHYLMVLWGLYELNCDHVLSAEEKRHALLAYKSLQLVWFAGLPKGNHQSFKVYIRDRIPESAIPKITKTFDMLLDKLVSQCRDRPHPKWVQKHATVAKISVESFPYRNL